MQQVALPSLYAPRKRSAQTQPFPLVRPPQRARETRRFSARRFFAGMLFGLLMSATLALFGYEARLFLDQNPNFWREAVGAVKALDW
jgi:hypothetical protein